MKIWLLEDGARTGPYEIYEIRDRISDGELSGDTSAWYEGADGWVSLRDVPAYASYFRQSDVVDVMEEEGLSGLGGEDGVQLGNGGERGGADGGFQYEPLRPVRRFFARLFDIYIYTVLLYFVKVQFGVNPLVDKSLLVFIADYIPYLLMDALALSYWGTTPGKWLLGIVLRSHYGAKLDVKTSMVRSARVWVLGFSLGSLFAVISLPLSWFIASKYGKFLWDVPMYNVTRCINIQPLRVIAYIVFICFGGLVLVNTITDMFPPELAEKLRESLEAAKQQSRK